MPGARYARRPISGLRAAFGGWPSKRGLRTAVAGAPPRDPGLSPLRGPGPAGRILYKDGLRPNPCGPSVASGWPAAKVGGARFTDQRTSRQHPARRRAAGAMPLPESLRNRTGSAPGEARPLPVGARRTGDGKLRFPQKAAAHSGGRLGMRSIRAHGGGSLTLLSHGRDPKGTRAYLSHLSQRELTWSANLARSLLAPPLLCSMTAMRRFPAA